MFTASLNMRKGRLGGEEVRESARLQVVLGVSFSNALRRRRAVSCARRPPLWKCAAFTGALPYEEHAVIKGGHRRLRNLSWSQVLTPRPLAPHVLSPCPPLPPPRRSALPPRAALLVLRGMHASARSEGRILASDPIDPIAGKILVRYGPKSSPAELRRRTRRSGRSARIHGRCYPTLLRFLRYKLHWLRVRAVLRCHSRWGPRVS
jgi:hypothetical protein